MNYISHRGNLDGRIPKRENSPDYIDEAIEAGFSVEVDLHRIGNDLFLGHDFPQYLVDWEWLDDRRDSLLIHAKNFAAARWLSHTPLHFFCHSSDPYTITSNGYIWVHNLSSNINSDGSFDKPLCILPLMTFELLHAYIDEEMAAVCTDFPYEAVLKYENR